MKKMLLLLVALVLHYAAPAQRNVPLRTLWTRPQVHVLFGGYTLSFTIKDIDKALELLSQTGNHTYGSSCGLDTAGNYYIELYAGNKTQYRNRMQEVMQKAVGAFLLTAGRAYIVNAKRRNVPVIISDIQPVIKDMDHAFVSFYDPKKNNMLFYGDLPVVMYKMDLGLD